MEDIKYNLHKRISDRGWTEEAYSFDVNLSSANGLPPLVSYAQIRKLHPVLTDNPLPQ